MDDELVARLEHENAVLRKELWEQWQAAHADHCYGDWSARHCLDDRSGCNWPLPEIIPGPVPTFVHYGNVWSGDLRR